MEKNIQDKASGDMFGTVKTFGKAFLLAFVAATLTNIAYGEEMLLVQNNFLQLLFY